ncbi:MAG: glycosyltransferase family 2 protein [Bacteroidales bacterium]|nr:glycosyltransferase family 2 protein [Bacteroidales bacterium]
MATLSILAPCYNEEDSITLFYNEIVKLKDKIDGIELEFLFVDDGSTDNTYNKLVELSRQDPRVKYISFSRNFGKEAALFSGLRAVTGDCTVVLDVDLQHPPEKIIEMYQLWQEGYEIVEGIKTHRGKESIFHKMMSAVFYGMISRIIGIDMRNSSDFKLLDKTVVTQLAALKERDTFFRALSYWVGFRSISINYEVQDRIAGKTKWSFFSLFGYAVKNLISFSYAPLHLISIIGIIFLLIGIGFAIDAFISYLMGKAVGGYPTLVFLIILSSGGIMLSLGIVGIYIAKIYDQIKERPQYIIKNKKE